MSVSLYRHIQLAAFAFCVVLAHLAWAQDAPSDSISEAVPAATGSAEYPEDASTSPNQTDEPSAWETLSKPLDQPLVLCFVIIALGMGLGSVRIAGLSLGTSGVLFAALLLGHLGRGQTWAMPAGVGTLGLVLFVYAVGLGAGPTFFRTFRDQGKQLAFLGIVTVLTAAACTAVLAWALEIPADLATGIFSGSLTSTPALAAGIQAAEDAGQQALAVSIGYGMAYPVGVVAVVMFVQLLPRILRVNLDTVGDEMQQKIVGTNRISRCLVRVSNPVMFGKSLHEIRPLDQVSGQITRVLVGNRLVPIKPDHVFAEGQVLMLVTEETNAEMLTMILGEPCQDDVVIDSDHDRADVVITSPAMLYKALRELHLRSRYGVTIARIERYGVSFVPNANTSFSMADRVTAVGEPEGLKEFEKDAGHRIRKLHETDLMSVGLGLVIGLIVGMIPIWIPGFGQFALGLAGGPLLVGLLFAHFGRFMGIVGYMPLAARMLTQQLGLAFFLAAAGFDAGSHLLETLQTYGATPFLMSLLVAFLPLIIAYGFARWALRMNILQILGGTCGAMTSTAGIGAITNKTDCDIPVTSYAAAYPAALVMMTILAQTLIALLG